MPHHPHLPCLYQPGQLFRPLPIPSLLPKTAGLSISMLMVSYEIQFSRACSVRRFYRLASLRETDGETPHKVSAVYVSNNKIKPLSSLANFACLVLTLELRTNPTT